MGKGPTEPLLNVTQTAHLLDVSASTVRDLADSGKLTAQYTAGGHRRFDRVEVETFLSALIAKDRGIEAQWNRTGDDEPESDDA